jgi:starch synthase
VVHANDWHAGLTPAYLALAGAGRPATVQTIHNIAFQGNFPAGLLAELRLPPAAFSIEGVEFHGKIGFLKAGLHFADHITTVSPTYAREIQTPDHGMGLDGLLRHRARQLTGILNGIDDVTWNPSPGPRHHVTLSGDQAGEQIAQQGRAEASAYGWIATSKPPCSASSAGLRTKGTGSRAAACRICWRGAGSLPCWDR